VAGRNAGKATDKPAKHKREKLTNANIKPTFPQNPQREADYAQICAKGLELKSYMMDPQELKAKYGTPKEPMKQQWPYTGHPQEVEDVEKIWSKEKCIEEVQAIMDEIGIECLPSAQMLDERSRNLKFQIQKYCKGMKNLADMMNVKTWQANKFDHDDFKEAKAVEVREVEEKVHELEEKVQLDEAHADLNDHLNVPVCPVKPETKTFTEQLQAQKDAISIPKHILEPVPEDPHNNMRYHYDRFRDKIESMKKDLEEAEHNLAGFVFAAEVMGVEL